MLASNGLAIDLQSVSYRYPQCQKVALSEISYTFPTGTTAIVGPNGAGKSTLVKLLTGLLAPTAGSITVRLPDDICLPPDQAHRAVLFQEPSHLYLTIRQNITMRFERTPTEDTRIHEALAMAGLRRVVEGLPDGIDTLVGAGFGGRLDLSGGQWQRLALARLIYQDAPVMILDEPVASLDPEGERAVFELFAQLHQAKVILFTTHRYDSIPRGTKIVVLVDGRIAEVGTHEELLQRQRHYWSLYVTGSTADDNSLRHEPVRTTPAVKSAGPESSFPTRRSTALPRRPADETICGPPVRRFGTRVVYLKDLDAAASLHNGSRDGLSPDGRRSTDKQTADRHRHSGADDGEVNFGGRVGQAGALPLEVEEERASDPAGHRVAPHRMKLRRMEEGVCGAAWASSEAEDASAARLAAHHVSGADGPVTVGGEHVR